MIYRSSDALVQSLLARLFGPLGARQAGSTDLMGICLFTVITLAVLPSTFAKLMTVATGEQWTKERLLEAAERTIDLEHVINARSGLDRAVDVLPERFLRETVEDGPGHGTVIDLYVALDSYYESMGWALGDGLPTPETLSRLDLEWTAVRTQEGAH